MDPTCSICSKPMEIKCDDCFGANYFCRTCCLDAHQRSPYHRILRWTGSHFVPMSLYQLGFILHLGHHGLYCICPDAMPQHEQLLQAGLFPSSFEEPETAFTFSVLDDFLVDNLECKTTAQQYFSKLQSITNRMFPFRVPVCIIATVLVISYAHMLIVIYRTYTDIY